MALHDSDRPALDPQRVVAKLRDDGEAVHLARGADVRIIAESVQVFAPGTHAQCAIKYAAVILKTIPGHSGGVVENDVAARGTKEVHKRPAQQRVLQAD